MNNSRTNNIAKIIKTGIIQRIASIIVGFLSQWAFIHFLGLEYVSLDGLFSNILYFLSLAELGIGSAIIIHLYEPLANDDKEKIRSIMFFYKKAYNIIGFVIFAIGLCFVPFLDKLINFDSVLDINIYLVYILCLFNTCLTYWFFAYKSAIISADQKGYILNNYGIINEIGISFVKFVIVLLTNNFIFSLIGEMTVRLIYNVLVSIKANKLYPYLNNKNVKPIERKIVNKIFQDVKFTFIINVSSRMITSFNDLILSYSNGTISIGYLYMYNKVIAHIANIVNMITASFSSSIGNLIYNEEKDKRLDVFYELNLLNYWVATFCSACLLVLLNPFIEFFYGNDINLQSTILEFPIVLEIVLHFYFGIIGNTNLSYKNAFGLLKNGWQIQTIGSFISCLISLYVIPKYGIIGMYLILIMDDIFIIYIPNLYYLFKDGFNCSFNKILLKSLKQTLLMIIIVLSTYHICSCIQNNTLMSFILKLIICMFLPNIILLIVYNKNKSFKKILSRIKYLLKNKQLKQ